MVQVVEEITSQLGIASYWSWTSVSTSCETDGSPSYLTACLAPGGFLRGQILLAQLAPCLSAGPWPWAPLPALVPLVPPASSSQPSQRCPACRAQLAPPAPAPAASVLPWARWVWPRQWRSPPRASAPPGLPGSGAQPTGTRAGAGDWSQAVGSTRDCATGANAHGGHWQWGEDWCHVQAAAGSNHHLGRWGERWDGAGVGRTDVVLGQHGPQPGHYHVHQLAWWICFCRYGNFAATSVSYPPTLLLCVLVSKCVIKV